MSLEHSIEITNIGPINNAKISLDGLSIIVGSNKSGKSTITLILFVLRNTILKFFDYLFNDKLIKAYYKDISEKIIDYANSLVDIRNLYEHGKTLNDEQLRELESYLDELRWIIENEFINLQNQNKLAKIFVGEIKDAFQDEIYNIMKMGETQANISFQNCRLSLQLSMKLEENRKYVKISIEKFETKKISISNKLKFKSDITKPSLNITETKQELILKEFNIDDVPYVSNHIRSNLKALTTFLGENDMIYLPPGRSLVIQNFTFFNAIGLNRFSSKQLPSPLLEFLYRLNQSLSEKKLNKTSTRPDHANYFEQILLEGTLETSHQFLQDQIVFREGRLKTPIERSAAMIQDLAAIPLILFNKRINDLVIEEPEAHLHPKAQLKFASWLTRYINYKVKNGEPTNILVTTHSPNIIRQIQNFISGHKIGKPVIESELFDNKEIISPKFINLYNMKATLNGYSSEFVKTELKGFEKEVFGDVTDILYQQYKKITKLRTQR
ncbi:MAG: AAA family ATPase [Candidatus Heimdallarchaeota archaeon]|nr:AAA family ATPase [Candidatus Heimdallarchaeota archaeon]